MDEIELRRVATAKTERRYRERPFNWAKQATCIHLARYQITNMGHDFPIIPRFRSPLGAKKALLATGWQTLPALMDAYFHRIPPAFMRVGDLLALPGSEGWHAIVIKADKSKFLGWCEHDEGCTMMEVDVTQAAGAWRL